MAAVNAKARLTVYEMCGGSCARCHAELNPFPGDPNSMDVDHIIPKSLGGPDDLWNLQPLCARCNRSKGASESTDYRPPLVRRKYDPQREQWLQSQSRPQNQIQQEGLPRIPEGSGSVTTLPAMSFGWSLRWRYAWMPNNGVPFLFWGFCFWIVFVWAIAWLIFQAVKPRPGSNRYLAFDAAARRRYTIGCIVAGSALFFLIVQLTPSSDDGAAANSLAASTSVAL